MADGYNYKILGKDNKIIDFLHLHMVVLIGQPYIKFQLQSVEVPIIETLGIGLESSHWILGLLKKYSGNCFFG